MFKLILKVCSNIGKISYVKVVICYVIFYNNRIIHISHINCDRIIQIFAKTVQNIMER
jgi:hypothetical protein